MRIGLFADRLGREATTGVGGYVAGLAAGLQRRAAHDYVLVSTPERDGVGAASYGGMPLAVLDWPRRPVQAAWTLTGRPRIAKVAGAPVELLHVLVPSTPVPSRAPLVVTIHDLAPLVVPDCFTRLDRRLLTRAVRHAARHAAAIVTVSEYTRREVIELLGIAPGRVTAVHHGPPGDVAPPLAGASALPPSPVADGRPYLLFVGELTPRKEPERLVAAFGAVAARHPDWRLVLTGSPGLASAAVARRIAALGLGDRVVVAGHLPRPAVLAALGGAGALVLPSRHEGFGLPTLEAMAAGTALVVSDAGALPEVVGDAAIVVPARDTDALAAALDRVMRDPSLRDELVDAGRQRLRFFSWERAAAETAAVHDRVLAASRS